MGAAAGSSQRPIEVSQRPVPTTQISASIVQTQRPTTQPRSLMFINDEDEANLAPTALFNNFQGSAYPPPPSIFSNNNDDRSQFEYGSDFSADYL